MIRKSLTLLALALVAAAVAAPIAQSSPAPKVDPLAVGWLIGQGLTPSHTSWTTGACPQRVKAASCYAMFKPAAASATASPTPVQRRGTGDFSTRSAAPPKVDPLAVGWLMGYGLSASQVTSWTTGACSQRVKAASCYAMFKPAATSSAATSSTKEATGSTGFQWGDAGIGAGFTLGIVLLLGAAGAGLPISRRNGRHQTARAA